MDEQGNPILGAQDVNNNQKRNDKIDQSKLSSVDQEVEQDIINKETPLAYEEETKNNDLGNLKLQDIIGLKEDIDLIYGTGTFEQAEGEDVAKVVAVFSSPLSNITGKKKIIVESEQSGKLGEKSLPISIQLQGDGVSTNSFKNI